MPAEEASAAPKLHGVTLEQYAGVRAALAEELPLERILANEGIDAARWPRADAAWKLHLATGGPEASAFKAYREKLAEAEDWLARGVSPLDGDLEAWLSFLRALSEGPEASALLKGAGLRMSDVSRLQRSWAKRLEGDHALQRKAEEISRRGPKPLPTIHAEASELKAFPWSMGRPTSLAAAPDPVVLPPSMGAMAAGFAATSPFLALPEAPTLPFVPGAPSPEVAYPSPPEARRKPSKSVDETALALDVPRGPALPFVGAEDPPAPPPAPTAPPPPPAKTAPPPPARTTPPPASAIDLLSSTAPLRELPEGPALPFVPGAAKAAVAAPASPPPAKRAAKNLEETAPMPPLVPPAKRAAKNLEETAPMPPLVPPAKGPVLPFAGQRAEKAPPVTRAPEELRATSLSFTMPKDLPPPRSPAAAPAGGPSKAPSAAPPLTLEQHALVCVELAMFPERAAATLARYRLTPARKEEADGYWRAQVARDPALREAWNRAYEGYYRWLLEQGRGRR